MKVRYCPNCKEYYGGGIYLIPDDNKCFYCENLLTTELNIEADEFDILYKISSDDSFLQAMIKLKESDPIEYQLKLSQFKSSQQVKEDNRPKCPTCGSMNLSKFSTASKAGSVALWGLFSQKVKKTWHCSNCGYEW